MKKLRKILSVIISLMMIVTSANLVMAEETAVVHDYKKIYAGDYNDYQNGDTNYPVKSVEYDGAEGKSAGNLNSGSWIKYEDVEVTETVNKLSLKYFAGGGLTSMFVRIGSETAEPIVSYATKNTNGAWGEDTVPFAKALEAGTYDIYLTFDGFGFDLNYFGFSYDEALETPHNYEKIYAGRFNASYKGTEANGVPTALSYNSDYALRNVYASNWVMYEDVEIKKDVNVMNLEIDTGTANTYVDLYIDAPNVEGGGKHLARLNPKNTGWAMVERKTKLIETLAAGTYDIYLVFDGARNTDGTLKNKNAAADISWFGFDYISSMFYGGTFETADKGINSKESAVLLGSYAQITHSTNGTMFYDDIVVEEKVNLFKVCYDSNGAGTGIELRLASQDGEAISRVAIDNTNWALDEKYALIEAPIEPGTYDVYITVANNQCGVDIAWCSLEYDEDFDLSYEKQILAGSFDDNSVIAADGVLPPSRPTYNDGTALNNTWGGNAVQYKNVNITNLVNTFSVSMATSANYAGNTINLRVGSVDGEILATIQSENTNWGFVRKITKMTKELPAGTYDIWLTFDNGANKSCDIEWFSLGYVGKEEVTGEISITEVTFSDVDFGEPVDELKDSDAVTVSAKVNSTWPLSGKKYVAYAALYEGGKLMNIYPAVGTAAANTTTDINFDEAFTGFKTDSKIKVFVWSGEEGEDLQPYAAADGVKTEIAY